MEFTKIAEDAFENIQMNAGILVSSFTPATNVIGDIIGATSGGVNFTATPTYSDWGDDVDNAPKNTKELKHLDSWEAKMSGTFVTVTAAVVKDLVGAADVSGDKITPRNALKSSDFKDIWWVGDYSDKNTGTKAGYVAIHLINGLSNSGFTIQSSNNAKGTFAFEYMGHYSIDNIETPPFEIYVKKGVEAVAATATKS